tara:strand:- start:4877 stop:5164 length:288 start_codon:yes stop_codon:yes gene_type:complete
LAGISVTVGDVLAITLRSNDADAYNWSSSGAGDYTGGSPFLRFTPGSWQNTAPDHVFRTYVDTAAVPEPGSLLVLLIGIAGVMATRNSKTGLETN